MQIYSYNIGYFYHFHWEKWLIIARITHQFDKQVAGLNPLINSDIFVPDSHPHLKRAMATEGKQKH